MDAFCNFSRGLAKFDLVSRNLEETLAVSVKSVD